MTQKQFAQEMIRNDYKYRFEIRRNGETVYESDPNDKIIEFNKYVPVPYFESRYIISSTQKTIIDKFTGAVIIPEIGYENNNYYIYKLETKDKKKITLICHYLLAKTFLPNPYGHTKVGFLNKDKTDLSLDNLYWYTPTKD